LMLYYAWQMENEIQALTGKFQWKEKTSTTWIGILNKFVFQISIKVEFGVGQKNWRGMLRG
jgi:hypothetical protein